MIKKIVLHFWNARDQFIRYFITGASGVVLDIGTLYLFKEYFGLEPVMAVVVNQFLIIIYIFSLNKFWAFKAQGMARQQFIRFSMIVLFNYLFAIMWMWVWSDLFVLHYLSVRLANIVLSVSWNFLLYKHWVYKK
ncbi:MAG: GtrA family protein [bacterium]